MSTARRPLGNGPRPGEPELSPTGESEACKLDLADTKRDLGRSGQ